MHKDVVAIFSREAVANNRYIRDTYDVSQPTKYILYTECNNSYGASISQPLSYADFRWFAEIDTLDVSNLDTDSDIGYVIDVDLL